MVPATAADDSSEDDCNVSLDHLEAEYYDLDVQIATEENSTVKSTVS